MLSLTELLASAADSQPDDEDDDDEDDEDEEDEPAEKKKKRKGRSWPWWLAERRGTLEQRVLQTSQTTTVAQDPGLGWRLQGRYNSLPRTWIHRRPREGDLLPAARLVLLRLARDRPESMEAAHGCATLLRTTTGYDDVVVWSVLRVTQTWPGLRKPVAAWIESLAAMTRWPQHGGHGILPDRGDRARLYLAAAEIYASLGDLDATIEVVSMAETTVSPITDQRVNYRLHALGGLALASRAGGTAFLQDLLLQGDHDLPGFLRSIEEAEDEGRDDLEDAARSLRRAVDGNRNDDLGMACTVALAVILKTTRRRDEAIVVLRPKSWMSVILLQEMVFLTPEDPSAWYDWIRGDDDKWYERNIVETTRHLKILTTHSDDLRAIACAACICASLALSLDDADTLLEPWRTLADRLLTLRSSKSAVELRSILFTRSGDAKLWLTTAFGNPQRRDLISTMTDAPIYKRYGLPPTSVPADLDLIALQSIVAKCLDRGQDFRSRAIAILRQDLSRDTSTSYRPFCRTMISAAREKRSVTSGVSDDDDDDDDVSRSPQKRKRRGY